MGRSAADFGCDETTTPRLADEIAAQARAFLWVRTCAERDATTVPEEASPAPRMNATSKRDA